MTQAWKSRKAVLGTCAVLVAGLVAGAGEVSPASSLSLPLETPTVPVKTPAVPVKAPAAPVQAPVPVKVPTVKVPAVPVKVPAVPVKTPTVKVPAVPVKVPAVPVKVPTVKVPAVPVKVPAVPVKVPAVPVKLPAVPVKLPVKVSAPTKTTTAKTPSAPVKVPPVSIKTPPVSAKTPAGDVKASGISIRTTTGSVTTPSVSVGVHSGSGATGSVAGAPVVRRGASRGAGSSSSAASTAGAGGVGTSTSPIGAYGPPGVGYNKLAPPEGPLGRHARARVVRHERMLKAIVAHFHGFLAALPSSQRELLELRTGYGDKSPLSPRATAARLHLDPAQVGALEKQAVRELHQAATTNSCARTGELVSGVLAFIATGFGDGQASATGGVKAVRYESPATTRPAPPAQSTVGKLLGTDISPTASDVLLVLLVLMGLGAIVAVVLADAAGQGPRHEVWRQRVINRIRSLR